MSEAFNLQGLDCLADAERDASRCFMILIDISKLPTVANKLSNDNGGLVCISQVGHSRAQKLKDQTRR